MKIQFLGGVRGVTGSKHLLSANNSNVLIDCGLFQGRRDESITKNRFFNFVPSSIDAVVLGHAHIDHSGNLPNLVKHGFNGPIYATEPTDGLCHYMLPDTGYLQELDAEYINKKHKKRGLPFIEPIFTIADALESIKLFVPKNLNKWFDVADGIKVKFVEAGHILGSALTLFKITEGTKSIKIAYIVDLGRKGVPLLRNPQQVKNVDYVIIESTYGNKEHEPVEIAKQQLVEVINRTYSRGGKVIIPSFALERAQELLFFLHQIRRENAIPKIPIYIDSPLAINITQVFTRYQKWLDEETQTVMRESEDLFEFGDVEYVRNVERSKMLNSIKEPMVIISASGMAEAGRILHHLINNIEDPRNTIMIVGFMAENTLGRKIADGWKEVPILGDRYKVKAEVFVSYAFSSHADRNELLQYLSGMGKVKKVFVVHGEETQSLECALEAQKLRNIQEVYVPHEGDIFEA